MPSFAWRTPTTRLESSQNFRPVAPLPKRTRRHWTFRRTYCPSIGRPNSLLFDLPRNGGFVRGSSPSPPLASICRFASNEPRRSLGIPSRSRHASLQSGNHARALTKPDFATQAGFSPRKTPVTLLKLSVRPKTLGGTLVNHHLLGRLQGKFGLGKSATYKARSTDLSNRFARSSFIRLIGLAIKASKSFRSAADRAIFAR